MAAAPKPRRASPEAAIDADEFARLIAALGPFEPRPHLAVAVSGGADSLALCLLARDWATARGGAATALTVDHGLRPESAAEAKQVGRWLKRAGIAHRILRWRGEKPTGDIQAAARDARYRLLKAWCRDAGVLHLLLGHHRDDQAETFLLRLDRGSGLDGLAGMAPIAEADDVRFLRPLLSIAPERLRAALKARRQDWIDDPSNRDPRHRRVALRSDLAAAAVGTTQRIADTAFRLGRARRVVEDRVTELLADAVRIWPEGYLSCDRAALAAVPAEIGLRALSRCLTAIGGGLYSQRLERLERLYAEATAKAAMKTRTLAGCRIEESDARLLISREVAASSECIEIGQSAATLAWDGRFLLFLRAGRARLQLRLLGTEGWAAIAKAKPSLRNFGFPASIRASLPALWDLEGVVEVPHLSYGRRGMNAASLRVEKIAFRPTHPLSIAGFGFS